MKKRYFAGAAVAAMILTAGMATTSFADWSQQNGKWYYYNDNNGRLVRNDWVCSKDAWYYMDYNGVMQTNSLIDDTYYVNENGVMITNTWKYINNSRWNESGWRYFGANGKAYTNGWKHHVAGQGEEYYAKHGNRSMTCGTTLRIPFWISAGWRSMVRSII